MDSKISLRALEFCRHKGITAADFERISGLANGMLKKLGDNTRKQTYIRISNAFPDLNEEWLRTGNGEMIRNTPAISNNGENNVLQHGQAGHDLTQTNNSEKLLKDFIDGLKSQNKLTEKVMSQLDRSMSQTDKAMDVIFEQKNMMERLISIIENR